MNEEGWEPELAEVRARERRAREMGGTGRIDGRRVVVGGDDFTVRGGASDAAIMAKQVHAERTANALRVPLVRLVEGTGGGGSVRSLEDLCATPMPRYRSSSVGRPSACAPRFAPAA